MPTEEHDDWLSALGIDPPTLRELPEPTTEPAPDTERTPQTSDAN